MIPLGSIASQIALLDEIVTPYQNWQVLAGDNSVIEVGPPPLINVQGDVSTSTTGRIRVPLQNTVIGERYQINYTVVQNSDFEPFGTLNNIDFISGGSFNPGPQSVIVQRSGAGTPSIDFATAGAPFRVTALTGKKLASAQRLWTPSDASTPAQNGYDATNTASITMSSNLITEWAGQGTSPVSASQVNPGSRPTYNATGINGKPAVVFNNGPFLNAAYTANGGPFLSICGVAQVDGVGQTYGRLFSMGQAGQEDYASAGWVALSMNDSSAQFRTERNNGTFNPFNITFGLPFIFVIVFNGSSATLYLNGAAGVSNASAGNFAFSLLRLGMGIGGNGERYSFSRIGAMYFTQAALTADDAEKYTGRFADQFQLQASLPSGHPYKSAPPMVAA